MTTKVRFWVDPICPWCWVTSQWIIEVAAERDLEITWQPISLFIKNEPVTGEHVYEPVRWTYGLLRVMEAVRATAGEDAVGSLYVEFGRRIHHDGERMWDPAAALEAVGLDASHAAAADDEQWDAPLRERMDEGLALVGNDVGTPIIAFVGRRWSRGRRVRTGDHQGARDQGCAGAVGRVRHRHRARRVLGDQAHSHPTSRVRRPSLTESRDAVAARYRCRSGRPIAPKMRLA